MPTFELEPSPPSVFPSVGAFWRSQFLGRTPREHAAAGQAEGADAAFNATDTGYPDNKIH